MNYVFIRGLARNKFHWYGFEKRFEKNSHVIMLDIPGNGEFNDQVSKKSIKENTDILREQSLKLKKNEKYVLIGISLGGMIAIDWLYRYEMDFERIVVINTSAKNLAYPWQRFNWKLLIKIPRLLFASYEFIEATILRTTLNLKSIDQNLLYQANLIFGYKTNRMNFFRQILAASNFRFPFGINAEKLVIVYSKNDRLVSSVSSIRIIERLNCRHFIHQNAGHDLPLDDADWLYRVICDLEHVG